MASYKYWQSCPPLVLNLTRRFVLTRKAILNDAARLSKSVNGQILELKIADNMLNGNGSNCEIN